jgi:tRNA threonylcarbamoyladenosine biosynthesis protein TsaB
VSSTPEGTLGWPSPTARWSPWSSSGLYLALETSGPLGSVALGRGGDVLAEEVLPNSREQSSRILPAVQRVLETAGVRPPDLNGIVVGAGPGSFTGVRIAAATAKGLAHALNIPMWAISSMAAAAAADLSSTTTKSVRWVLFDARADRLYGAFYGVGPSSHVTEIIAPNPSRLGDLLQAVRSDSAIRGAFCGDGAVRHESEIRARGFDVLPPPAGVPTAAALLAILATRPEQPALADPFGWEPQYVRAWGQ